MPLARTLPLPRVILVCADAQRLSAYHDTLECEGFEVLVAFDQWSALELCKKSARPVKAVAALTDPEDGSPGCDSQFARALTGAVPTVPCILLQPGVSAADCAVLIRTAMRCTTAAYLGSS